MGTSTPNFQLYKPDGTEFVDEDLDLNENWDKVDAALQARVTAALAEVTARQDADNLLDGRLDVLELNKENFFVNAAAFGVTNSGTAVNVPGFSFPVVSGAKYVAEFYLRMLATNFTPDGKLQATFPGGTICSFIYGPNTADLTAGTQSNGEWISRLDTSSPIVSTPVGLGSSAVSVLYVLEYDCTAAGTVQLQFAQQTPTAATTSTIDTNSFMKWRRIA